MNTRYEIQPVMTQDYPELAKLYARVFAGQPWLEVSRCEVCSSFSEQQPDGTELCRCGGRLRAAYPPAETTEYISRELMKDDATGNVLAQVALLRQVRLSLNGFSWGFRMQPATLAREKYRTDEMQQLVVDILLNTGFFYYLSEVGIDPELQGLGYGKKMTNAFVDRGLKKGYRQFVVRTNEDSALRYILEGMGMRAVLGLQTGVIDTENPARVLFVGNK